MSALARVFTSHLNLAGLVAAILLFGGLSAIHGAPAAITNCPSPTVQNSPCAKSGYHQAQIQITADPFVYQPIVSLPLAAGKYVLFAKLDVVGYGNQWVSCRLSASTSEDFGTEAVLTTFEGSISLNLVRNFTSPGAAVLECTRGSTDSAWVQHIRITALKLGTLINGAI